MFSPRHYYSAYLVVGTSLCLGALLWFYSIHQMVSDYSFTTGTIVDFEQSVLTENKHLRPVVHFLSSQGEMMEVILQPSVKFHEGDSIALMYPSSDPTMAREYSEPILWGGPTIILLVGIALLFFSFGKRFIQWLDIPDNLSPWNHLPSLLLTDQSSQGASSPTKLSATIQTLFVNVERNHGARVDGRRPYCIYSQWRNPETSEIHFFKSDDLWFDPTAYIKKRGVTVHVEPDNLDQYNVDLSFLPDDVLEENSRLAAQHQQQSACI